MFVTIAGRLWLANSSPHSGTALSRCAAADLTVLPSVDVASMVVDLRRVATRLEAEIARVVHAAAQGEAWRSSGATSVESWLANETTCVDAFGA